MYASRVYEGHFPHSNDANLGLIMADVGHQVVELVGNSEEVRPVNLIDGTAFGDNQMLFVHKARWIHKDKVESFEVS